MSAESRLQRQLEGFDVLVLPGWKNSGPAHWQTLWEDKFPEWKRVQQADWNRPRREDWGATLDRSIAACQRPAIVIAHSLGCITLAHRALRRGREGVAAAVLVAPADVERSTVAASLRGFGPIPAAPLPFPSLLVASDNDPACRAWRAAELAAQWHSDFVLLPGTGHINADSGLGEWDAGLGLVAGWLQGLRPVATDHPTGLPLRWVA